jgi:hypothetical protein
MDASQSGSAAATSDDVNGKDGTVEASRPVASAYRGNRFNRYGRRPSPWPGVNPDPKSMNRLLARHKANNATQSSEEGDVFEPLPAPRKYFARQARRNAARTAVEMKVAAPLSAPQEHPSRSTSRLNVRPGPDIMERLATRIEPNATQSSGDDDLPAPSVPTRNPLRLTSPTPSKNRSNRVRERILSSSRRRASIIQSSDDDNDEVAPLPPRNPLKVTFSRDTNTQGRRPSKPRDKRRFDSLNPESGHYVPGGRKLSNDCSDASEPAKSTSDDSENLSESVAESTGSNPGHNLLRMLGHFTRGTGQTRKRPSLAGLEPSSSARPRDGSRPTTGTNEINTGQAVHNLLNMFPGDPTRSAARRSVTAIPKVPDDLGVLPVTYAEDDGRPGPSSRTKSSRPAGIEEEEEEEELDDDERSPTDTRAPQLPETFRSSQRDVVSQDFPLNSFGTQQLFDGWR